MGNDYKVLTLCKEGYETDEDTLEKDTSNRKIRIKDSGINYAKLDDNTRRFVVELRRAEDSSASATAEETILYAYKGVSIVDVGVVPDADFGQNNDYASLEVRNYGTDGGTVADSTLASMDFTSANSVTKFEPKSLGTINNASVSAGEVLTVNISKSGSGEQLPAMLLYLVCERTE